ncbi:hypothetical protein MHLP_01365 [Candidatus Mycoplasma haematolamae str. Purdue]|uniref:Uncharacterized protein n=1 Tax=Mycoplasma haematolamae (strain Purdue) TaxID=1212765 RepID=I7BJ38_MYCHA|nr:hypothetical protein [Candidatus Mycoplasma haematolamae]AFO51853.1 hypothetical protein MHLP_01365 [Candidatus Mycoplasma haematolamae str. Purdue]
MIKQAFSGIAWLGAAGGVGTAGVFAGPGIVDKAKGFLNILQESERGKPITYTFTAGENQSQTLTCAASGTHYASLKLKEPSYKPEAKARIICQDFTESPSLEKTNVLKADSSYSGLECKRTENKGDKQSYKCELSGKTLTLRSEPEGPSVKTTTIVINW